MCMSVYYCFIIFVCRCYSSQRVTVVRTFVFLSRFMHKWQDIVSLLWTLLTTLIIYSELKRKLQGVMYYRSFILRDFFCRMKLF